MHISEIWRYPIKSMRGERLASSEVLRSGLLFDRAIVCASKARGRMVTARTHPGLLGLQGSAEDGVARVNGLRWDSAEAAELVSETLGETIVLIDLEKDLQRFDVLPLLVATDGALAKFGYDTRRFRANIIVGEVAGDAEREWPGRELQLGAVRIRAAQLRMRCVMTTYDPDSLDQDVSVLKRIVRENAGTLALDCEVVEAGTVQEGDAVRVVAR